MESELKSDGLKNQSGRLQLRVCILMISVL